VSDRQAPIAVQFIIEQLEGSDEKLVIFGHRDVLALAKEQLAAYKPVMFVGGMSAEDKNESVERFQSDPACCVFLGYIQAAGVGLTLTKSAHVIFIELDFVPANVSQAEDRCHRLGQEESVLVQHLVIEDSLDAKMAKTIIDKQKIARRNKKPKRRRPR
jgi:SWI/SNF-related matrix-associated actin-dependent regulator 1 of chromatin subfamily A